MKNIQVIEWVGKKGLEAAIIIVGSFDERRRIEFNVAFNRISEKVSRYRIADPTTFSEKG